MARKKRSERTKEKGKGLFHGFFRNLIKKDNMDEDITTGVNESLDVSPDNSTIGNVFDIFGSGSAGQTDQPAKTDKAFLGLESAKKNKKQQTTIMVVAAAIILLILFMKKK
jgi:hypothetical protein